MLSRKVLAASRAAPCRVPSKCWLERRSVQHTQGFATEALATFSQGYIDLALALPIPPSWPTYSTTIISLTAATRLCITLPVSVWAKQRQWRAEELVMPRLRLIAKGMKQQGYLRDPQSRQGQLMQNSYKSTMKAQRNALFKKYRCSPWPTMLLPQLAHLPLFIGMSLVFQQACLPPTPLDSEAFFTLQTLVRPDTTAALPIIVGLLSMANVDTSKWLVGGERARELLAREQSRIAKERAEGLVKIRPQMLTKTILRLFSVLRIVIGMAMPGAVIIYWTTSSAFSLIQSWAFDYWEGKRKSRLWRDNPIVISTDSRSQLERRPVAQTETLSGSQTATVEPASAPRQKNKMYWQK